ncbi:biotin-dependent carboxyltransferase family protein [Agromyces atrinae]|uniref:5-oxoprolinase subunit C family protein n=1 Tax=Agromyces atrinae TaxID=592376 RepID=UPI001F58EFCA|nr:biotin-dependent carboxyltransferase family protein [Agromyces atrinae]MCI2957782.1 biotin-dependent carboxyltransferase family protein [Agromyces atrinae]
MSLHILTPGPLALVEDLGRPGFAHLGVSASGALDRSALRLANRLVGNPQDAAGIEITMGLLEARFDAPTWFAITGAEGDVLLVRDGMPASSVPLAVATHAEAGDRIEFGPARHGVRFYLSIRGGIDGAPTLGSRSSDTLSGLGPAPLSAGQTLALGVEPERAIPSADALTVWAPTDDTVVIDVVEGPRTDRFDTHTRHAFFETTWSMSASSNRVGARLDGPPLPVARGAELPSEGMVAGSIQIPPSGLPTILLADHPVTGGYPVIAVVSDASLDAFAQVRPGQHVRFRHAH